MAFVSAGEQASELNFAGILSLFKEIPLLKNFLA